MTTKQRWYATSPDAPGFKYPMCSTCGQIKREGHINCTCWANHPEPCDRPTYEQLIERVAKLEPAAVGLNTLITDAQMVLARYLPPNGPDVDATITALLELFDGPKQREVQEAYCAALAAAAAVNQPTTDTEENAGE